MCEGYPLLQHPPHHAHLEEVLCREGKVLISTKKLKQTFSTYSHLEPVMQVLNEGLRLAGGQQDRMVSV